MKNIIKTTVLSMVFVSFLVSCNNDFLERYPLDQISDASYWKTANDLRMFSNTWYSDEGLLPTWGTYNMGPFQVDGDSDTEARTGYSGYLNGEQTIATDGDGWGYEDWWLLRQFNYFMDHYPQVEALTSFDVVKQYVGEALFFRSLFYFNKLMRFGDLPWASTTVTAESEVLKGPRLPRNQIVDYIMEDMDKAVEYLPAQAGGAWTGRVTKETALALQSRIALFEGTWEKYHNGSSFAAAANQSQKFLQKAADVSDVLIRMSESGGYPALDGVGDEYGYRDLFNQMTYANSKEVIFWRKYKNGVVGGHWHWYTFDGGGVGATKNLIDSYLKLDGTPVAAGYDDSSLKKVAENRDPRLAQTINIDDGLHHRFQQADPPTFFIAPAFDNQTGDTQCSTGYQLYKSHDFRRAFAENRGLGENALIYFRYGEVLLNYAEAKAELGTITQGDLDRSINKLRNRVKMPPLTLAGLTNDPNFEFKNLSPIIQEVRRERKVELAVEGFRLNDIRRWAAAGELIVGYQPLGAKKAQWVGFKFSDYAYDQTQNGRQERFELSIEALVANSQGYIDPFRNGLNGGTAGYKFNVNRDYLFPLPTTQLTLNKNLKQNPGW